jgi:hypothetical protein
VNVGLPGSGIGGLFFVISALVALPIELGRLALGRGSVARLRLAVRHGSIALAMVGVLLATYWLLSAAVRALRSTSGKAEAEAAGLPHLLPLAPVLATLLVLAMVLTSAFVLRLVAGARRERGADAS